VVNNLERPDGEVLELGVLNPPPGRYCRAIVVFGPADADSAGLPPGAGMEGKTLLLEGEVVPAEGGPARPFRLESSGVAIAEPPLENLSFTEEALEQRRVLVFAYDRWLDDVPWDTAGAAEQVLNNIVDPSSLLVTP
jgi:hypothetical protein